MSQHTANILFHIEESLLDDDVTEVEHDMAFQKGVRTVCFNCNNPHLMLVDYDPLEVNSQQLLSSVQSRGLHAALVGF